jgi:Tfp pilus assembly protein PilX
MPKSINNNSGMSIIATVMLMMILALFAAVAVSLVTTSGGIGLQEEQGDAAFYIAEAGLQKTLNYIIKQKDAGCATSETCACTDAAAYANTNPSLGAGSFNVATTPTHVTAPTTLNGSIIAESYTPSIPVTSDPRGVYATSGRIMIDREIIEYTSLTAATFEGCKRGVAGTTAASHASGTRVGQKQCTITSTGTISTNPLVSSIQRQVSTVTELQNGWAVGGAAFPSETINSVHCTDANNCWAVGNTNGTNGTIAHWNGTSWTDMTDAFLLPDSNLNSVYCTASNNCWAVGNSDGTGELILQWDGSTWSRIAPSGAIPDVNLNSVHCISNNNCWAGGNQSGGELIIKWDGSAWTRQGPFAAIADINLNSVFILSAKEVWIVGNDRPGGANAVAYRWRDTNSNGVVENAEWAYTDPGVDLNLYSIFMFDTDADGYANDGWIVGQPGGGGELILRWNGAAWNRIPPSGSIPNVNLNSVHCAAIDKCWAVGDQSGGELIIQWNGSAWSRNGPYADIPNENLNSVYMVSATDGWAVGDNGTIARWNGTNWFLWTQANATALRWNHTSWSDKSVLLPIGTNQLNSVSMLSYADGWAVGNAGSVASTRPSLVRWSGSAWTSYDSSALNINRRLNSVYCVTGNDCWAAGNAGATATEQPLILWFDGTTWARRNSSLGINVNLNSVYCVASNDCWAVGAPGGGATERPLILWWNGTAWQTRNSSLNITLTLNSIYCAATDNCWAVGNPDGSGEFILQWNGTSWSRIGPSLGIPNVNLNSVYCSSTSDCWIVGNRTGATTNGWVFLRWNGSTWSQVSVDTAPTIARNLNSVFMLSYREGYAMGNNGAMFQWDGSAWSRLTAITGADLYELYIIGSPSLTGQKGQWREVFQ